MGIRSNSRLCRYADGFDVGTGAAINIALGWIPREVRVFNLTDGDRYDDAPIGTLMAFTSGGVTETKQGSSIKGLTSGAKARVNDVVLVSGSWAGGDAAGFFVLDASSITGTFGSETIVIYDGVNAVAGATDDGTVTAQVTYDISTVAAVGAVSSNKIVRYAGVDATTPAGFTIGSDASESGKRLFWQAWGD